MKSLGFGKINRNLRIQYYKMKENVFLVLLACYGLTFILMHGKPLNKPRNWIIKKSKFIEELLKCSFCVGLYSGAIISLIIKDLYILLPLSSVVFCGLMEELSNFLTKKHE